MKIKNSARLLCSAIVLSTLVVSCTKKTNTAAEEDPTVDSSKIVTGTIEVENQKDEYSGLIIKPIDTDSLEDFADALGTGMTDFAASTVDTINSTIDTLKDSETVNAITEKITSTAETLTNPDTYTEALDSAKESISSLTDSIKDSEVVTNVTEAVGDAIENLGNLNIDQETQDALDSLKALTGKLGF